MSELQTSEHTVRHVWFSVDIIANAGPGPKKWFGLLVFNGTFSTNRLHRATEVGNISRRAGDNTNT